MLLVFFFFICHNYLKIFLWNDLWMLILSPTMGTVWAIPELDTYIRYRLRIKASSAQQRKHSRNRHKGIKGIYLCVTCDLIGGGWMGQQDGTHPQTPGKVFSRVPWAGKNHRRHGKGVTENYVCPEEHIVPSPFLSWHLHSAPETRHLRKDRLVRV